LGAEVTREIRGPCMLAATLTPSSSTPPSNGRGSNTRSLSIVKLRLQEHGQGPVRTPCLPFELAILVAGEKNRKKEIRKKEKQNRPAEPPTDPAFGILCLDVWHASTVAAMRVFIQTRFAAMPHFCPLVHACTQPNRTRPTPLSSHHLNGM